MPSAFPVPQDDMRLPAQMHHAAVTAPVLRELRLDIPGDTGVKLLSRVRINGRTLLTVLSWPGDHAVAIRVLHCLVDNAAQYGLAPGQTGKYLSAYLRVTEAHELVVDVTDPNPTFPGFDQAIAEKSDSGLGLVAKAGGALSWFLTPQADAKTVRAVLPQAGLEAP
ncbi:ATP-binding protein [Streptomyces sp. NPDC054855]